MYFLMRRRTLALPFNYGCMFRISLKLLKKPEYVGVLGADAFNKLPNYSIISKVNQLGEHLGFVVLPARPA